MKQESADLSSHPLTLDLDAELQHLQLDGESPSLIPVCMFFNLSVLPLAPTLPICIMCITGPACLAFGAPLSYTLYEHWLHPTHAHAHAVCSQMMYQWETAPLPTKQQQQHPPTAIWPQVCLPHLLWQDPCHLAHLPQPSLCLQRPQLTQHLVRCDPQHPDLQLFHS